MHLPAAAMLFRITVLCAALFAVAAAVGLVLLLLEPGAVQALAGLEANPWWFEYQDPGSVPALAAVWRIASAVIAAGIGVLAAFRAFALFDKSGSPLLPFLILFLLSLSLEGLRAATALLDATDSSIDVSIVLTRVLYWGRFVGLLALLVAGLYCVDMKYRKYGVLSGAVFLVSFVVAAYIPVDRTVFLAQMTWKLGDEQGVWFVNLAIGLLALLTTAGGALLRRDRRFLWLALGVALLLTSREILFFSTGAVVLAGGLVCLGAGTAVYLRTLAVVYRTAGE